MGFKGTYVTQTSFPDDNYVDYCIGYDMIPIGGLKSLSVSMSLSEVDASRNVYCVISVRE